MAKIVRVSAIIGVVIALLLIGILLPIGLENIVNYNGSYYNASNASQLLGVNTTMGTLVGVIIPIMVIIGLVMAFVSFRKD